MTKLVFEQLMLLSLRSKAARKLDFHPKVTILTGENNRGKSSIIKSLYYAMGTEIPNLMTQKWKHSEPIYALKFSVNDQTFIIIRDGRWYGLFDGLHNLLGTFGSITKEGGLTHKFSELFGYTIKLEHTKTKELHLISPAHFFLPYYIDQDKGWTSVWNSSFDALNQLSDSRDKMIEYHLSIKPEEYYKLGIQLDRIQRDISTLRIEKNSIINTKESIENRRNPSEIKLAFDLNSYNNEIEQLKQQISELSSLQAKHRSSLINLENKKAQIHSEIVSVQFQMKEIQKDYKYAFERADEELKCPVCGSFHTNTLSNRYSLYNDIESCRIIEAELVKSLAPINNDIAELNDTVNVLSLKFSELNTLLGTKINDLTLHQIIELKTSDNINSFFSSTLNKINNEQENLEAEEIKLKKQMKELLSGDKKKNIKEYYQGRMKQFLSQLDLREHDDSNYTEPTMVPEKKVNGSRVPRTVLARYYSLLWTMHEFSENYAACPIVIDTPNQQDQSDLNLESIYKFIFENKPSENQLILATRDNKGIVPSDTDYSIIHLDDEFGALEENQFDEVNSVLENMHKIMLDNIGKA